MNNYPFCAECKHHHNYGECVRKAKTEVNIISGGEYMINLKNCYTERLPFGFFKCGKKGRYFEPKTE